MFSKTLTLFFRFRGLLECRKRYENASVGTNFLCDFDKMKTEVFENALVWTGPK